MEGSEGAVSVIQGDFLAALGTLDQVLVRGSVKKAEKQWRALQGLARAAKGVPGVSPGDVEQMNAIVAAQRARVDHVRAVQAAQQWRAAQRRKRRSNAVCSLCGEGFWRGKADAGRRTCSVCRPYSGRSVRTVSGGLPTLGKN